MRNHSQLRVVAFSELSNMGGEFVEQQAGWGDVRLQRVEIASPIESRISCALPGSIARKLPVSLC